VARELEAESYHDIKRITARKDNVIRLWEYLLELLKARRHRLEQNLGLQRVFQEMLYIMDWMDEMKVQKGSEDVRRGFVLMRFKLRLVTLNVSHMTPTTCVWNQKNESNFRKTGLKYKNKSM